MTLPPAAEKGSLWHGYRRPILKDRILWLAVAITGLALAAQSPWSGAHRTVAWVLLGLDVTITIVVTFAVVGVVAGTVRGFGDGWRSGERPAPRRVQAPRDPGLDGEADRPAAGVELERRARALGRAIRSSQDRLTRGRPGGGAV